MSFQYTEIFVPGGLPKHTYNPRTSLGLEAQVQEAKENLCKLVTVTGHTKSGKTVLVRNVFPPLESVWIDGGSVEDAEDFWASIQEQLDGSQTMQFQETRETTGSIGAKGSAEANFLFAKGTGELNSSLSKKAGTTTTKTLTVTPRVAAIRRLGEARKPVIIDDFHYIKPEIQGNIIRALKPLIFDGLPVIIIAIPHRRYDALKVEREMTGRVKSISIPTWNEIDLSFISKRGFELLQAELPSGLHNEFASQSIGSPHLMQDFCRTLCRRKNITPEFFTRPVSVDIKDREEIYSIVAESIGRPMFDKLAKGPTTRTDRMPRRLKSGKTVDIYELVLHALARLKPGLEKLDYEEVRAGLKEILESDLPQLHEVSRVLEKMSNIAATDRSSTPVIEFMKGDREVHITDPYFAFFLRWGNFAS
jgi:hypothetical protein